MYLSDRDIRWAVEKGTLIINPSSKVDPTSIDLHLDRVEEAQIWDTAKFICFVDGKSTRARAGIVVHLTAPTIHAGWYGKVVLEIANLGPLTFVLQEDDVIAQLTVAMISSIPQQSHREAGTSTLGQTNVKGESNKP